MGKHNKNRKWRARKDNFNTRLMPQLKHSPDAQGIIDHFIQPLIKVVRENNPYLSMREVLDKIMGADFRSVELYKVNQNFLMPGYYMIEDIRPTINQGNRDVSKDQTMFIRWDTRDNPRVYEVQLFHSDFKIPDYQNFQLTGAQLEVILKYLDRIDIVEKSKKRIEQNKKRKHVKQPPEKRYKRRRKKNRPRKKSGDDDPTKAY